MLDLEPIKRRLSRVPAPPWGEFCESGDWWIQPADEEGGPRDGTASICSSNIPDMDQTIADFIVAAPKDVQVLIEEIERLREELTFFAAAELDEAALRAMDEEL